MGELKTIVPPDAGTTSRRRMMVGLIYGIWAAIASALSLPALVYLFFPPRARNENEWVDVGDIGKLGVNSPLEMTFRRNRVDGWRITSEKSTAWVVKLANGEVAAFGPQCTHLGCAYHWEEGKDHFLCPCHTSIFSIDGRVVSGPAPRPLDKYEIKLAGSKLSVGPLRKSAETSAACPYRNRSEQSA
jgi:menaquinol-cytochrome c reductase iron-sulfur subunit